MGQSASKSALKRESKRELNESKRELIYRAEVWMGIKTLEVEALQKSTFDAQKTLTRLEGSFCANLFFSKRHLMTS